MEDMQARCNEIDEELWRLRKLATPTRRPSTALKPRSAALEAEMAALHSDK
jgi:hypothetical protein